MTDVPLPEMPPGPSPEDLALIGLRKRFLELGAKISEYKEEQETIKDRARRLGVGKHPVGDGRVSVTPQKKFDADVAEKVLKDINPDILVACSRSVVQSSLVKLMLGDDVYERCQVRSGDDKVTIT